jgi:hypothetical protein
MACFNAAHVFLRGLHRTSAAGPGLKVALWFTPYSAAGSRRGTGHLIGFGAAEGERLLDEDVDAGS